MKTTVRTTFITALLLLMGVSVAGAQSTCSALIQRALEELDQTCSGLTRNTVCYGNTQVQATFADTPLDLQFSIPSDKIALSFLSGLRASALDETEETWGLAVMNTQANLPGALPGQGVVMLIMGDTEVTNEVPATDAFIPGPPVEMTVNTGGARVRSGAGTNFTVAGVTQFGEIVQADAKNPAGDWVRIVFDTDQVGWMFAGLLDATSEQLNGLPVVDPTIRTPMQAFYFSTGIGNPNCNEAPDAVLIQSPQGASVTMSINAAEVTIGSTIYLETDPASGDMGLFVLDGVANVNNLVVPAGYKAFVSTTGNVQIVNQLAAQGVNVQAQSLQQATGQWGSCTVIDAADRQRLSNIPNIPAGLLNYPISLPGTPSAFCAPPGVPTAAPAQPTSVPVTIPAPIVLTEPGVIVVTEPAVVVTGCDSFRLASPRDGMAFGFQTFYWDPAQGAASYDIFVYDNGGNLVAQGSTSATTIDLDTGDANPFGSVNYSWTAQARDASGNVICGPLPPAVQLRSAAPDLPGTPEVCDIPDLYKDADNDCMYGASVSESSCSFSCYDPPYGY